MTAINTAINVISKPKLNKEYKNVLQATNQDYYSLNKAISIGDEVSITFSVPSINGSDNYLIGTGVVGNRMYISKTTGAVTSVNFNITSITADGVPIPINSNIYGFIGQEIIVTALSLGNFNILFMCAFNTATLTFLGTIFGFTLNGEIFTLVGNGDTIIGSLGTILTIETMHLNGLNYINIEIIKPK